MKNHQELLQTETYWTTKIQVDLYQAVETYLQDNKMTRTQFAEKLGVTKGYVTQILKGDFDHRLSKLVEIALLIGKVPIIKFEDMDAFLEPAISKFNPEDMPNTAPAIPVLSH